VSAHVESKDKNRMSIGEKINHNEIQKSEFATRQETQALGNTTKKNVYLLLHKCMVKYTFCVYFGTTLLSALLFTNKFQNKTKTCAKIIRAGPEHTCQIIFLGPK